MNSPCGLAFDPSGNLHVANFGSNDIAVFTPEGKYSRLYGKGNLLILKDMCLFVNKILVDV